MDRPHIPPSDSPNRSLASGTTPPWSADVGLSSNPSMSACLRPDRDTCLEVPAAEVRPIMNSLSVLLARLRSGEIVVPASVCKVAMECLVSQWRSGESILVGRDSRGDVVVKSSPRNVDTQSYFVSLQSGTIPVLSGLVTDRDIHTHWPQGWQDYQDLRGQMLLDHCCGRGGKVAYLRQQGIMAYGIDVCAFGPASPEGVLYGRAERLPFMDKIFDRVESRMGVFQWGHTHKQVCREALAEIVRVTKDGGIIRILPAQEQLMNELIAERSDLYREELPRGFYGAFELKVCG